MATQTEDHSASMAAAPGEPATPVMHEGTGHAGGHESAGLPQFDFQWWPGQILWFLIIFGIILVFMKVFAAPKVGGTIEAREGYIAGQITDARAMKDEADAKAAAAVAELAEARARTQKLASDARAKVQAEAAAKLAEEEARLAALAAQAEARIAKARESAMTNVRAIASDTAGAIVEHLTGKSASAAELTGARK